MNSYVKFGLLSAAVVGSLTWLAVGGISDTKTYYKTIKELDQMGDQAKVKRIRVGGDVDGNVTYQGHDAYFTLVQKEPGTELHLKVVYSGVDPLPDTMKAGAQALAEGKLGSDNVFHATKIQAKCASKYEAKLPAVKG